MAKTVGQILEDVKDIDTIIQCFRAVCYPNKTEEDVKKALRWVENFRTISILADYKNYLCNLEIKEEEK